MQQEQSRKSGQQGQQVDNLHGKAAGKAQADEAMADMVVVAYPGRDALGQADYRLVITFSTEVLKKEFSQRQEDNNIAAITLVKLFQLLAGIFWFTLVLVDFGKSQQQALNVGRNDGGYFVCDRECGGRSHIVLVEVMAQLRVVAFCQQ